MTLIPRSVPVRIPEFVRYSYECRTALRERLLALGTGTLTVEEVMAVAQRVIHDVTNQIRHGGHERFDGRQAKDCLHLFEALEVSMWEDVLAFIDRTAIWVRAAGQHSPLVACRYCFSPDRQSSNPFPGAVRERLYHRRCECCGRRFENVDAQAVEQVVAQVRGTGNGSAWRTPT